MSPSCLGFKEARIQFRSPATAVPPRRTRSGIGRRAPRAGRGGEPATTRRSPRRADRGPKARAGVARRTVGKPPARDKAVPSRREISAGGVVYRRKRGRVEVALAARRTQKGELVWGLAKGQIEPGESPELAAVREVREETGLEASIEASLGTTRYFYVWDGVRVRKSVHFFLMQAIGGDVRRRDEEMEDVRWFPMERALKKAAYRGERIVLARAAELLS